MFSRTLGSGLVALALTLTPPAGASVTVVPRDLGTAGGPLSWGQDLNESNVVAARSGVRLEQTHAFLWRSQAEGMIDLGTLGGDRSEPAAVNSQGEVAGWSRDSTGAMRAFVWTEVDGMIDLGTLGGASSRAIDIGEDGTVLGWASAPSGTHGFVVQPVEVLGAKFWFRDLDGDGINDLMTDLGTLGGNSSTPAALDGGVVVGWSQTAAGQEHAFIWSMSSGMIDLGTLGGNSSRARAIAGDRVVGHSGTASGETHAFVWTATQRMVDLGVNSVLGGAYSSAIGVTPDGLIVGHYGASSGSATAFAWFAPGSVEALPLLDLNAENTTEIRDLNASREVVGRSGEWGAGANVSHAFLWSPSAGMTDIGLLLAGTRDSDARAINASGVIVGEMDISIDVHAFAYFPTGPGAIDLGTLGGDDSVAIDVSDAGHVVGHSRTQPDEVRGFRWDDAAGFVDLGTLPDTTGTDPRGVSDVPGILVGGVANKGFLWWPTMNVAGGWRVRVGGNIVTFTMLQNGNSLHIQEDPRSSGSIVGRSLQMVTDIPISLTDTIDRIIVDVAPNGLTMSGIVHVDELFGSRTEPVTVTRSTAPPQLTVRAPVPGRMTDLGNLGLGGSTAGEAVNDFAEVVGRSGDHAFLWDPATGMTDLGTLGSDEESAAVDLNNAGDVVGTSSTRETRPNGCTFDVGHEAVLWRGDGSVEALGGLSLSGQRHGHEARAINERGVVVGESWAANFEPPFITGCERLVKVITRAFVWTEAAGVVDLGALRSGESSTALDVNDQGEILGTSGNRYFLLVPEDRSGDGVPDRWFRDVNSDGMNDLMYDLGSIGEVRSLNDSTWVVGRTDGHAHLWQLIVSGEPDNDGDGFSASDGDCDDANGNRSPALVEVCDGVDNNCDGSVDEGLDADGDGICDPDDGCPNDPGKAAPGLCGCGVPDVDTDGDFVVDCQDNCPLVSASLVDSDQNGIGDACQCGDVSGDGFTNVVDALQIARGEVSFQDPNFLKCDVNGDTFCNTADALVIARGELGSRHEDQLCPAYGTPPACGNDLREAGEECDGIDDAFCPGRCLSDCTCAATFPCGGIAPLCSGTCPLGETCIAAFNLCLCFAIP